MSSCDRLSQASCTRCHNLAMVVADSRERVRSRFIMSNTCWIGERYRDLDGQGSCCTTKSLLHHSSCMWMCTVRLKSTSPSCQRIDSSTELPNLFNVAGTVYFTLQKHLKVTVSCNWWPSMPWSLRWGLCVMGKFTPEDDAHQVYAVHMYIHHSHKDRTYSHHWRQQIAIQLPVFHDTRVAVFGSIMVKVVAWPEAHVIWVLLQAGGSQWSLWQSDFFPGCCLGSHRCSHSASVLCGCPQPGLWVWECSTDHCWKQRHTDTLCPTCAAIHSYVHLACCISQSTTVTACKVKTEATKTGLLDAIWLLMTAINESQTLQSISMHIYLVPMNTVL